MHKQRLMKTPALVLFGLLSFLVVPAAAQAHHIDLKASCDLNEQRRDGLLHGRLHSSAAARSRPRRAPSRSTTSSRPRFPRPRSTGAPAGQAVGLDRCRRRPDPRRQGGVHLEGQRQLGDGRQVRHHEQVPQAAPSRASTSRRSPTRPRLRPAPRSATPSPSRTRVTWRSRRPSRRPLRRRPTRTGANAGDTTFDPGDMWTYTCTVTTDPNASKDENCAPRPARSPACPGQRRGLCDDPADPAAAAGHPAGEPAGHAADDPGEPGDAVGWRPAGGDRVRARPAPWSQRLRQDRVQGPRLGPEHRLRRVLRRRQAGQAVQQAARELLRQGEAQPLRLRPAPRDRAGALRRRQRHGGPPPPAHVPPLRAGRRRPALHRLSTDAHLPSPTGGPERSGPPAVNGQAGEGRPRPDGQRGGAAPRSLSASTRAADSRTRLRKPGERRASASRCRLTGRERALAGEQQQIGAGPDGALGDRRDLAGGERRAAPPSSP